MRIFEIGDLIGYSSPEEGYIYGIVTAITETELEAEYLDDSWESFWAPKEEAEYIEPIYLSDEAVIKFARYEITFKELVGDVYPPQKLRAKERYALTIDDLLCVLRKANGMSVSQFTKNGFFPFGKSCGSHIVMDIPAWKIAEIADIAFYLRRALPFGMPWI